MKSLHGRAATSRRAFFEGAFAAALASGAALVAFPAFADDTVEIENFDASGKSLGLVQVAKLVKSDDAWRKQLSAISFEITRREGTEVAFTGPYWDLHADGLFRCICCNTAVFDSRNKFDSGTGWPSFYRPISHANVAERSDHSFGMLRTKVSCRRCDAHLGHVFTDGPQPTGLRYCIDSVALLFAPRTPVRS